MNNFPLNTLAEAVAALQKKQLQQQQQQQLQQQQQRKIVEAQLRNEFPIQQQQQQPDLSALNLLQMQLSLANLQQLQQPPTIQPNQMSGSNSVESAIALTNLTATLLTNMLTLAQQNGTMYQLAANQQLASNFSKLMQAISVFFSAGNNQGEAQQAALLHSLLESPNGATNLLLLQQLLSQNHQKPNPIPSNMIPKQSVITSSQVIQQNQQNNQSTSQLIDPKPRKRNHHLESRRNEVSAPKRYSPSMKTSPEITIIKPIEKEKSPIPPPSKKEPTELTFEYTREHMEKSLDRILREEILNIFDHKSDDEDFETETGEIELDTLKDQTIQLESEVVKDGENRNPKIDLLSVDGNSAFRKVSRSPSGEPKTLSTQTISPDSTPTSIPSSTQSVVPLTPIILRNVERLASEHALQNPSSLGDIEKMPVIWQGTLAMKTQEAQVQMHLLAGSPEYVARSIGNTQLVSGLCLRINQRMRCLPEQIKTVVNKLEDGANTAMLVCLPVGETREELNISQTIFESAFIEYFQSKLAAGIANVPNTEHTSACVVHVFPPGDFANHYLKHYSRDFYNMMLKKKIRYLVVIITPETDPQNMLTAQ